jgi:hypothetical protein
LRLKSGVYLFQDAGATLKDSPKDSDYDKCEQLGFKNDADSETSFFHFSLTWAEDAERIGVIGEGTTDSNYMKRHGPKTVVAFKRCRFVDSKGVCLLNAPNHNISLLGTDYVNIDGVTILNGFADGIDPDGCRNVRIGLDIDALQTRAGPAGDPLLQFINVQDALLRSSRAPANTGVYFGIRESQETKIELRGNQLQNARTPICHTTECGRTAPPETP